MSTYLFVFVTLVCLLLTPTQAKQQERAPAAVNPTPSPSHWPKYFTAQVFSKDTVDPNVYSVSTKMYYDSTIPAQRLDHGAGAYECKRFYNTTEACTIISTSKGMYAFFPLNDTQDYCCLDSSGAGPLPPNWVDTMVFNSSMPCPDFPGGPVPPSAHKQQQLQQQKQENHLCNSYVMDPPGSHNYYEITDADMQEPVLPYMFSFPNPLQSFYWEPASFSMDQPKEAYFKVPQRCQQDCPASLKRETHKSKCPYHA